MNKTPALITTLAMTIPSQAASIFFDGFLSNVDQPFHDARVSGLIEFDLNSEAANTPDLDAFFFGGNLYGSIFENPIEGSIIQIGSNTFLGGENRNGNIILVTEGSTSGVGEATVTAQNTDFISGGIDAIIGASSTVVFRGADNTLFNSGNISDLTAFRNALADGDITFAEAIFSIRAVNGQGQEFSGRYILDDPFIQVSGVPEPSTSMALALALIGGLARRKRG